MNIPDPITDRLNALRERLVTAAATYDDAKATARQRAFEQHHVTGLQALAFQTGYLGAAVDQLCREINHAADEVRAIRLELEQ